MTIDGLRLRRDCLMIQIFPKTIKNDSNFEIDETLIMIWRYTWIRRILLKRKRPFGIREYDDDCALISDVQLSAASRQEVRLMISTNRASSQCARRWHARRRLNDLIQIHGLSNVLVFTKGPNKFTQRSIRDIGSTVSKCGPRKVIYPELHG